MGATVPMSGRRHLPVCERMATAARGDSGADLDRWTGEPGQVPGPSVQTELVALNVLHDDAGIGAVVQKLHTFCAERQQSFALGLKCG